MTLHYNNPVNYQFGNPSAIQNIQKGIVSRPPPGLPSPWSNQQPAGQMNLNNRSDFPTIDMWRADNFCNQQPTDQQQHMQQPTPGLYQAFPQGQPNLFNIKQPSIPLPIFHQQNNAVSTSPCSKKFIFFNAMKHHLNYAYFLFSQGLIAPKQQAQQPSDETSKIFGADAQTLADDFRSLSPGSSNGSYTPWSNADIAAEDDTDSDNEDSLSHPNKFPVEIEYHDNRYCSYRRQPTRLVKLSLITSKQNYCNLFS